MKNTQLRAVVSIEATAFFMPSGRPVPTTFNSNRGLSIYGRSAHDSQSSYGY